MTPPAGTGGWSLQDSLLEIARDPVATAILASLPAAALPELAARFTEEDVYNTATVTRRALAAVYGGEVSDSAIRAHFEHLLGCARREALRRTGGHLDRLAWRIEEKGHLEEVREQPTILLSPMTLASRDALELIGEIFAGREILVFGEGLSSLAALPLPPGMTLLADHDLAVVRTILAALRRGGVFCTYPDFVFDRHRVLAGRLFGQPRLFSAAFAYLCMQEGVHVLPAVAHREGDTWVARVEEPVVFTIPSDKNAASDAVLQQVVAALAALLERQIRRCPEQWLLLGTLAAESIRVPVR